MSFFKKVNDTEDTSANTWSDDKSPSYADVNSEISDLDSLLDKVLAEKKAERPAKPAEGEIRSVKAADLLKGSGSSQEAEETEPETETEDNEDFSTPACDSLAENESKDKDDTFSTDETYSALLEHEAEKSNQEVSPAEELTRKNDGESATDLLGDDEKVTDSAASILADETPYESSADDILAGNDDHRSDDFSDAETDSYDSDYSDYSSAADDTDFTAPASSDSTEDALLVQIDAFRDKAVRLSGLINANQKKVMSLEAEVKKKEGQISDKERQIASLQKELSKKQKEADALVTTVESQVDRMLVSVKREMSSLNADISDKMSRENKEESAKIAGVMDKVNSSVLEIKEYLAHSQDDISLSDVKEELSEKIHSENVKVYRNIQDTMKEMDHSEQLDISMDEKYRSLKHRSIFMLIVLIVNLGISAVMLLMRMGIVPENILSLLGL